MAISPARADVDRETHGAWFMRASEARSMVAPVAPFAGAPLRARAARAATRVSTPDLGCRCGSPAARWRDCRRRGPPGACRRAPRPHRRQCVRRARRAWRVRIHRYGPHIFQVPTASASPTSCRASPRGGPTSIACGRWCAGSSCRSRSIAPRSTCSTASTSTRPAPSGSSPPPRSTSRRALHQRGRRAGARRRRALRPLLPRLQRKQWGLELGDLAASVAARIGARAGDDDRYFTDRFQCMPVAGYTAMFARMLAHRAITVETGVDASSPRARGLEARHWAYTGPTDAWYGARFGALPYRSIRFEHEHKPGVARFQPVGTVNYPGADVRGSPSSPPDRATARRHVDRARVPVRRRRAPLSGATTGQRRDLPALPGARRCRDARHARRPARAVSLLQHGPYVAAAMTAARRVIERLAATRTPWRGRAPC